MDPINENEVEFYETLKSNSRLVQLYENLNLLKYAIDLVPTEDLNVKATLRLSLLEEEKHDFGFEDLLLLELLNWFKISFFKWLDVPNCDSCGQLPEKRNIVPPDVSEIVWGASRVENYFCTACQRYIRFPRYRHPKKLLETRQGRCGEWANCFTFLCRALGYDARFVSDWNDHVWTEVFSFSKNRWLHCDPCENICDQPLIYEKGWKKPISYVIAFSKDEIQDVTWRYTSNFEEVIGRRNLCREEWLLHCIMSFTKKLQADASPERKQELCRRQALELAGFLTPPVCNDKMFGGRTSGSIAWRIARGEAGEINQQAAYEFRLCSQEIEQKYFHVKYSCASDKYVRVSNKFTESENWAACAFEHKNIFRKIESDWKMVYLTRTEGSDKGLIIWKFNFKGTGLVIQTLKLNLCSATFEHGKVKWFLFPDSEDKVPKVYETKDVTPLQTQYFKGSRGLTIAAELTEGTGRIAWQHTQLFRQRIDSTEYPFEVEMSLDQL